MISFRFNTSIIVAALYWSARVNAYIMTTVMYGLKYGVKCGLEAFLRDRVIVKCMVIVVVVIRRCIAPGTLWLIEMRLDLL